MPPLSVTARLLGYLLLAAIVPLALLGAASFLLSRSVVIEQASRFHLQQVHDLNAYLGLYADEIESLAANIAGNEAIGAALRKSSRVPAAAVPTDRAQTSQTADTFARLQTQAQIGYILNSFVRVKGLVSIDLIAIDGRRFHVGDTLAVSDFDSDRVRRMLADAGQNESSVDWRGVEENLNRASLERLILMGTRVMRGFAPETGRSDIVGLLVINVDPRVVFGDFVRAARTSGDLRLMLVDRNGRYVYHSDTSLIGESAAPDFLAVLRSGTPARELRLDDRDVVLAIEPVEHFGGYLVGVLPRQTLTAPINVLVYASLALALIGALIIGLMAWRFSRAVVTPVRGVSEGFRQLQLQPDAQLPPLPIPAGADELADMVVGFNRHLQMLAAQRQAARDLVDARQAAEAGSVAKSRFLATMSHEIRTPMNSVLAVAQLLGREPLTDEQAAMVQQIRDAGEALLHIINDILDFSKIEAGQLHLERRPFSLSAALGRVDSMLRMAAEAKGLRFDVRRAAPELGLINGDSLRLEQVLINLVGNAIKFTERGGVKLDVLVVQASAAELRLRFEVRDTGIGIAPDALDRLFAPFTQADAGITRRFGGTGLGLAISKRLVEEMKGVLGAQSAEGEGTTFWFEIPFERASEAARLPAGPESAERRVAAGLGGLRVLTVDDNPMNQAVVERILRRAGASIVMAGDGRQALERLKAGPGDFDVVLMDVQMPVMDGLSATRELRADPDPKLAAIPVIAVSAGVLAEEREAAAAAGVSGFLAKPLDVRELVETLARFLPDHRAP